MSAETLRDFLLASIDRPQKPRLRISQAGSQCEREVYYAATGADSEPDTPESKVKMALGSALDAYALQQAPHDEVFVANVARQVPVDITMGDVTVRGSADAAFYSDETEPPVLVSDLKVVGESTWAKVQKAPKQEHQAQVQLYAFGLGSPRWSVLYVRAATGEMLEHSADTDEFAARRDFGLFETVAYYMAKGEPPPRPYADIEEDDGTTKIAADSYPCRYCRFLTTCWPGTITRKEDSHVDAVQEA